MKAFMKEVVELVVVGLVVSTVVLGLAIIASYQHVLTFEQRWAPALNLPTAKAKPKEATWFPCQTFSVCVKV